MSKIHLNYTFNKVVATAGQKYKSMSFSFFSPSLKNTESSCFVALHQSCEVSNFQQLISDPGIPFVQSKAGYVGKFISNNVNLFQQGWLTTDNA